MKHNILKSVLGFLVLMVGLQAQAQLEKNEVYLFTCPIADNPVYQQIAFKYVTVLEAGGQFQYFVMDAEAGNDTNDSDGEGHHLKFTKTLISTQNADNDLFVKNNSQNYSIEAQFSGTQTASDIRIDFDLLRNGEFVLDLNGRGPLYNLLMNEFSDVMNDSNFYRRYEMPTCTSHPNLKNYLD